MKYIWSYILHHYQLVAPRTALWETSGHKHKYILLKIFIFMINTQINVTYTGEVFILLQELQKEFIIDVEMSLLCCLCKKRWIFN